jgi:hypothetical protein
MCFLKLKWNSEKKELFVVDWELFLTATPDPIQNVEGGLAVELYENSVYGIIALTYINDPKTIKITGDKYFKVLNEIKKKTNEGKPFILFSDYKYKETCKEWNGGKNTTYSIIEFEEIINKET